MATTQAQRASLYNTLEELMGTEDAETLMQQLPPGDWDSMATKDDLQVLGATFTTALAEFRVEVTTAFADLTVEVTTAFADLTVEVTTAFADLRVEVTDALADIKVAHAESHAELVKSQARNLYITLSTIALATISIWIALLVGPTGG